jgi:hypothetical protein
VVKLGQNSRSVVGHGGHRRFVVVAAGQSNQSWFGGRGSSAGGGMEVFGWSCPSLSPPTWVVV